MVRGEMFNRWPCKHVYEITEWGTLQHGNKEIKEWFLTTIVFFLIHFMEILFICLFRKNSLGFLCFFLVA